MAGWAPRMGALKREEEKIGGGRRRRRNLGVVSLPKGNIQESGFQCV